MVLGFCAEEAVPSQHGLSEQMEQAAQEWFSAGPQDKVNFEVNLMVAQGPLGKQHRNGCITLLESVEIALSHSLCTVVASLCLLGSDSAFTMQCIPDSH